jgi:hypothetical protein
MTQQPPELKTLMKSCSLFQITVFAFLINVIVGLQFQLVDASERKTENRTFGRGRMRHAEFIITGKS